MAAVVLFWFFFSHYTAMDPLNLSRVAGRVVFQMLPLAAYSIALFSSGLGDGDFIKFFYLP